MRSTPGLPPSPAARIAAGAVALTAWTALAVQFGASEAATGAVLATAWVMLRYFTVIATLLVALVFTAVASDRRGRVPPAWLGGVTATILLVGVVFAVLLAGVFPVAGAAAVADVLLHRVVPVLVPLYWLVFARKGGLRRGDPWRWALIPALYFGYALARGAAEGRYAYPFMDVALLGWRQVAATAIAMALGFLATGYGLLGLDRWLAARP